MVRLKPEVETKIPERKPPLVRVQEVTFEDRRLNVMSQVGQQAARRYGVRGVPALVVVDGAGQAVYGRAGIPRPGQVIEQVETIVASN